MDNRILELMKSARTKEELDRAININHHYQIMELERLIVENALKAANE